ncbi:MAG TPA: MotA/TolQ/ExbB proton channel family protein [Holophaga sp.]|nr:MotA/TolQ/ExbB proton channel family protein [Holophaga sp.]HPS68168.1 MotA/TolQ/ExbB proton channel family protein [Holophaga sp.]
MNLPSLLPFALAEGSADSFGPLSIWRQASPFNQGIIVLLLLLLLLQVWIAVERGVMYVQSGAATRKFLKVFMEALRKGDFEAAGQAAAVHGKSHVALVLKHGLDIYQYEKQVRRQQEEYDVIQPVERAVVRGVSEVTELLKKGMLSLATIGALAPFIGLLGTVVGIIKVFADLKARGAGDINALAGSIGEALGTTALGLICAIPAVWIYNFYTAKQDQVVTNINNAASQMIDEFIRRESRR